MYRVYSITVSKNLKDWTNAKDKRELIEGVNIITKRWWFMIKFIMILSLLSAPSVVVSKNPLLEGVWHKS